jgi:CheY-like chemotaxis protein
MTRILVVDDMPELGYRLKKIAEELGDFVIWSASVQEALHEMEIGEFDLVLTDLCLGWGSPDSGLDVVKAAINRNAHLQVIVVSNFVSRSSAAEALALGAFNVLDRNWFDIDFYAMLRAEMKSALSYKSALEQGCRARLSDL